MAGSSDESLTETPLTMRNKVRPPSAWPGYEGWGRSKCPTEQQVRTVKSNDRTAYYGINRMKKFLGNFMNFREKNLGGEGG